VHALTAAEKKQREESSHPVFLVKLRNSDLIKDSVASLMLHVRGNPVPDVKLMKNGVEVKEDSRVSVNREHAGHGSYELVIHKVQEGDAGDYSAVATNSHGSATSEAKVGVKDAKDVFALLKGHEKTLKAGEEPTFTWFKSGQEFDPDDRFKVLFKDEEDTLALVFQHINPEDAGLYTCVANTGSGKISCSAELSVEGTVSQMLKAPEPPKILANLSSAETSPGGSAMMELKMKGYPRPNIRWTKDGKPLAAGDRHKFVYPDTESVALIINKVTGDDVGTYKAVLHNDLGEASTEAKLVLSGAPQFKEPVTDVKTGVDDPYKITALVTGSPELTWYKDGVPIKEDSRCKSVKVDPETFQLVFQKTATEDNGNWAVIARNPHGEMSQFFTFAAQMLPKFEQKLSDVEANESKQVSLKCKIKCEPRPDIKWFKNGQDITKDPRVKIYVDPTGNDVLTINSASRGLAGEFEIRATNEMGMQSCKCNLKINTKPSCDDMDDPVEAFEGDDFTFSVECDGSPKPVCKWTANGKAIDTSKKDSRFQVTEANGCYKLKICAVEMDDAGEYQAEFSNRAGDKKVSSEMKVHSIDELKIPKCMSDLKDKKANKGSKTFFNLKIRGEPLPEVKWFLNDVEIVDNDIFKTSFKPEDHTYRLDILDVQSNTAGTLKVIAKNENGEDTKIGSLEVQFAPEIAEIGECKAGPGDEAKIIAKVKSFPFAEGVWYRVIAEAEEEGGEAKVEKISAKDDKTKWGRFSDTCVEDGLEATHTLSIKDATLEDAGTYELSATNRVGHTEMRARLVVVTEEPSFPKPLQDITTKLGSTATFECCVAGVPKPAVEWYQGDKALTKGKRRLFEEEATNEGTIYKMTVRDIIMKDFGDIILKASNMVGDGVSPCIFQIIQVKPTIVADFPKMQEVKEGGMFELSAKIDGSPPPTAVWLCEGEEIKADGERVIITQEEAEDGSGIICTLKITKCGDEDNGRYCLLVKNTAGDAKLETMLDVMGKPKPPKVVAEIEPKEITIPGKKDLRLKAKIAGFPMPTITWLRDGNEIKVRKGVLVSQDASGGATLVVEKCTSSDAGTYTAKGTNDVGEVETSCDVTVTQAMEEPKFTSLLRSAKAVEGSPIKLEGKMVGHPQPEIKWMYNDQEWEPESDRIKQFVNPDGTFGLIFESTVGDDKGAYVAIAYNSEGTARSLANVAIKTRLKEGVDKSAPSFARPMGDIAVDEGQKLRITTPIRGNPIPEFSWTKEGAPITSDRANVFSDGELIGIEIVNANLSDSGKYGCHLSNEVGTCVGECNAEVRKVYSAPLFSKQLNNIKQLLNCDAKFICDVGSNPKPEVSWLCNGEPIEDGGRFKIKTNGNSRMLMIKKLQESDAGSYACVAKNKEGTTQSVGTLEIVEFVEKGRQDAPEFLKKIGDEMVFRGMAARFTALVTGTPEPEFEFFFNNKPMFPTDRIHIVKERTGLIRLSMAYVEESDIGTYRLRVWNKHGEESCEARLIYDGLEVQPGQSLGQLYQGFEKYTMGGLPMPLPDKPLITQMSDTKVTLTWKPALPLGPNLAPYYMLEMAEYPDGDWEEVYEEVRGICCDINGLTPLRDYRFRVSVRNRFGLSDPSPYAVAHRSKFSADFGPRDLFLEPGQPFDLTASMRFPKGFDIYKEPYEGYTHRPHFLKQEEVSQYAVRNSCPEVCWNLYGFPMPSVNFKFEGKDIEIDGDKYTFNYTRNGVVKLQINGFTSTDVGTYECHAVNDHGNLMQPVLLMMAQYPEFIKAPTDVNLIGVNGGKVECEIYGVPKPNVVWYKDFMPLKETCRVQAHHYPPQTYTLFFEDYITKDEGLYTVTASNVCGSISYSVMVRILEDEQEYEWMVYRRTKQIIPRTKGFDKFYHTCEEIGRGTQGVCYFVQQIVPIESEQSGHHAIEEAESKYWWLHRGVKQGGAPTIDPCMVPYRFTGGNFAAKTMHGVQFKSWMMNEFEMMNVLHHPRLIRLVEVYDAKDQMILITELATGGELLDVITSEKYITEIEIARIVQQVLEGIEYMHSKSIGHLSLTPCDVLFTRPGGSEIKICDFALSKRIVGVVKMEYGQPEFVAPEIVNGEGATFASDMWSVGIITYLLLSGVSPFRGQNDRETLQRIQMGDIDFDFELWQNISREAKHFVANLLVYKPEERMSVRQALAHPWLQILKQPGIEISEQYQISTERLRNYYVGLKEWITNASCDFLYRRRPLHGAFTHPSCMVYPPGEPAMDVEPTPVVEVPEREEYQRPTFEIEEFSNPSNYQYGPDTYLLQVRDADFPARLREYLSVARTHSAEFKDVKCPIVKERRRFTDVMDEEVEIQREARLEAWGRDDFSIYKPAKLMEKDVEVEVTTVREVVDGVTPFFREKPRDVALTEGEPLNLSCLVSSEPRAAIQWLKNDLIFMDDSRLKTVNSDDGWSHLTLDPAMPSDVGLYKVVARNPLGQVHTTVRVVLGDISGPPDSPNIESMTDTDILISWKTPSQLNHSPISCYKVQMGYIDTDIDWVDLADDIKHEYFVVDNLRPSHGYKFRILAKNQFGWSIPSIPSGIVMTPSSGASRAEFYDSLQRIQAREDIEEYAGPALNYDCEKAAMKIKKESPGSLDYMSDLGKGRFSITANVNKEGKVFTVKAFDKVNPEGNEAAMREFKNLKTLRHERMVSLLDAFETEKMCMLKFDTLPGTDVLSYIAERPSYTEQMIAEIAGQVLDGLDYLHWRGRVYLNLEPGNILVYSGRSLGKTVQVKLTNFETTQTVASTGTQIKGTYNFDYAAPEIIEEAQAFPQSDVWSLGVLLYVLMSGQLPFKGETPEETKENILRVRFKFEWLYKECTMEGTRLLMWIFKRAPYKRPSLEEVGNHRWINPADYMLKKRERARFPTNRIQKFAREYHRSRPQMESDSQSFLAKLLQ
jgi:serine/threonine protein kinase